MTTAFLSNELTRAGTYIGWRKPDHEPRRDVKPSVADLVEAGFFYTGNEDIVRCFSCGLEIQVLEQHLDPHIVHASRSPGCQFVMGNSNGSRQNYVPSPVENDAAPPISKIETPRHSDAPSSITLYACMPFLRKSGRNSSPKTIVRHDSPTTDHSSDIPQTNELPPIGRNIFAASTEGTAQRGLTTTSDTPNPSERSSASDPPHITNSHLQRAPPDISDLSTRKGSSVISEKQNFNSDLDLVKLRKSAEARLQTFNSWTSITMSRAKEFSHAGFMYIGPEDRAQCVFCGGILRCSVSARPALETHFKHYPECSFAVESLSAMVTPKPRHCKYRTEPVRLSSFFDWDSSWSPKPAALAKAGFFFTGNGDRVKCFFCNGALGKWEPNDDPWREHARWFPKCPFVKQSKGQNFISEVSSDMAVIRRQILSLDKTDKKFVAMETNLLLLVQENRRMKTQKQCKVCLDKEVCVTFIPCGHLVCCLTCAPAMQACPICRAKIRKMMRIYMS